MTRKKSYLTVTDQFCGAGGSSIGAVEAGLEVRMALNHWDLAIETHNTNFPNTDHDCTDISACDPRRYPSTDILITSPECTTHSPAGGNHHQRSQQQDFFNPTDLDPATQRSRATMYDVIRFAEYHNYRAIIVENVVEVTRWVLFWDWWGMMEKLGYIGQLVSLNSMFALPTPQSRDRIYIVWTKKGNRKPDVTISPLAPCMKCGDVEARQAWKNGRKVGKYGARNQYVYTCPNCRAVVTPYYYCALNSLDLSIPAVRIGDRKTPLRPRTLERVRYGLEKYGSRPLQVTVNNKSGVACRVRGVDDPLFAMTTSNTTALLSPWMVGLSQGSANAESRVRSAIEAAATQTTCDDAAIAGVAPWMVNAGSNDFRTRSTAEEPAPVMTGSARAGLAFTPFMVTNRTNCKGKALDETLPVMSTGQHHALIQPAALVRLLGDRPVSPLDAALPTQTTGASQNLLASPSPFLIQYYGTNNASPLDDSVPSVTTKHRHGLVTPQSIEVDDCYFRMMRAHEIGAAMAFPVDYIVCGTQGQQIKQFGNAVTPPAMKLLIKRVVQSFTGDRAA